MRKINLLDAAEDELADAIAWYEGKEAGLGTALRESVETTVSGIQDNPLAYPVVYGSKTRRAVTKKFPYAIIFLVEQDRILIIAVFHTSRNPVIWRGRID